jgi:hypothetical protein
LDADFSAATREAGFERTENRWVINEDWGETIEADEVTGAGWQGIQANHVVRETDTSGNVTGINTRVAVLGSQAKRSAIIEAFDCADKRFEGVVQSFRFVPVTAKADSRSSSR